MNFTIAAEIYVRLAGITKRKPDNVTDDEWKLLKCVRVEHKGGHIYALASNRKIAAIYHLGTTTEPDGVVHIAVDEALVKQCETEKPFNSSLFVTAVEALGIVSAKTTLGYNYPGNAGWCAADTKLNEWRTWANAEPVKKSSGAMSWTLDDMVALNASSSSGIIAFPEHIDALKPVTLRDIKFDNWVGLFMPSRVDDAGRTYTVDPAELPEWWK